VIRTKIVISRAKLSIIQRLPNQPPIPERSLDEEDEEPNAEEDAEDPAEVSEKASPPPPSNPEGEE
jgi:hypothetical protein